MFRRIRELLFGASPAEAAQRAQLDQLVRNLQEGTGGLPLCDLRPVLIPSSIFDKGWWIGPYHHFPALPVSLTWAYLCPENTMQYLTDDAAARLTAEGIDWRTSSREALRADFDREPWSRASRTEEGALGAVALLHDDGLGPSRLLCYDGLLKLFPDGFQLYVPDRYSAFLLSNTAPPAFLDGVTHSVRHVHQNAGVPMSLDPHAHSLLREALASAGELA